MGWWFISELIIGWWFCAGGESVGAHVDSSIVEGCRISHLIDGVCGGSAGRAIPVVSASDALDASDVGRASVGSPPRSVSLAAVGCLTSCISTSPDGGAFQPSRRWRVVDVSMDG